MTYPHIWLVSQDPPHRDSVIDQEKEIAKVAAPKKLNPVEAPQGASGASGAATSTGRRRSPSFPPPKKPSLVEAETKAFETQAAQQAKTEVA